MSIKEFENFYSSLASVPELKHRDEHYLIKREALEWTQCHTGSTPIDYYEFGIYKGKTFRFVQELFHSESNFFGYDSFDGLPETWVCHIPWRDDLPKDPFTPTPEQSHNNFDLKGVIPDVLNGTIYQGLFQDTLAKSLKSHNHERRKVVLIDCDLYSSTMVILTQIHSYLKSGDIIIFDEFGDLLNEFKAFKDYKKWFYREKDFRCLFKDSQQKLVFGFEVI